MQKMLNNKLEQCFALHDHQYLQLIPPAADSGGDI